MRISLINEMKEKKKKKERKPSQSPTGWIIKKLTNLKLKEEQKPSQSPGRVLWSSFFFLFFYFINICLFTPIKKGY